MLQLEFYKGEHLLSVRQPCHGQSLFHCPRQVQGSQGALGQASPRNQAEQHGQGSGNLAPGVSGLITVGDLQALPRNQGNSLLNLKHILIPRRKASCLLPETSFPQEKNPCLFSCLFGIAVI